MRSNLARDTSATAAGFHDRGAQSRLGLILAAADCFAASGLEGATTRQIALRAGQNVAAINYYFGGKEALYLAVVAHIAETVSRRLSPMLDEIDDFLKQPNAAKSRALVLFKRLLGASVRTNADIAGVTEIIAREQTHPTKAFGLLYDTILERLQRLGAELIARYLGAAGVDEEIMVRFHALLGQALAFRLGRETLLRRTGWTGIAAAEEELICRVVEQQAEFVLRGLSAVVQRGAFRAAKVR